MSSGAEPAWEEGIAEPEVAALAGVSLADQRQAVQKDRQVLVPDDGRAVELASRKATFVNQPPDRAAGHADDGRSVIDTVGKRHEPLGGRNGGRGSVLICRWRLLFVHNRLRPRIESTGTT